MAVLQLTNLATLKTRLAIKTPGGDGALRQLLRTVSGHLAQKVNKTGSLAEAVRTELHDVDAEQRRFKLKAGPLADTAAVTSVIYAPQQDFANGSVITEFTVEVDRVAIWLRFNMLPPYSEVQVQALQVIYTGGLTDLTALRANDKYAPLEEACILLIQQIVRRKRTTPGKMNMSGQGGNVNLEALSQAPLIKELWQPIRRWNLGG